MKNDGGGGSRSLVSSADRDEGVAVTIGVVGGAVPVVLHSRLGNNTHRGNSGGNSNSRGNSVGNSNGWLSDGNRNSNTLNSNSHGLHTNSDGAGLAGNLPLDGLASLAGHGDTPLLGHGHGDGEGDGVAGGDWLGVADGLGHGPGHGVAGSHGLGHAHGLGDIPGHSLTHLPGHLDCK